MTAEVVAVCLSGARGEAKQPVPTAELVAGHGLGGDAHAGSWHRQVSLLAQEQVDSMAADDPRLGPGAFGENLRTRGLALESIAMGRRLRVGSRAVLQLTQLGKTCHSRCAIYHRVGDCVMPRAGVFARVRRGGPVAAGDAVQLDPELDRIRFAVVTLSDRAAAGAREDGSGPLVQQLVQQAVGGVCIATRVLPDDADGLARTLRELCDERVCDLVLTTGGTGLSPRDVTPEATLAVVERQVPGMAEAMRAAGLVHTPHAMLSRGVCGLRGQTLIINLSGSPKAVREQLDVLGPALPHAVQTASGLPVDCAR